MSVGENFKLSVHFPDGDSLAIILLTSLYFMVQVTVTFKRSVPVGRKETKNTYLKMMVLFRIFYELPAVGAYVYTLTQF